MGMQQATVRVADVAESIVATYLYGVVGRLQESSLPVDSWFRVTTGMSSIPLEYGAITEVEDPSFEVIVVVESPWNGLLKTLTDAAAEMPGRVTIMPKALLEDAVSKEELIAKGWKQTPLPRLPGVTPQFAGV